MNIQADIRWIQAEILKVRDPELISAFKNLLKYREKKIKSDWWNEIGIEEKAEIEEGIAEIERGEFISHEEVMANPNRERALSYCQQLWRLLPDPKAAGKRDDILG